MISLHTLPNLYLQQRSPHTVEFLNNFDPAAINEYGDIIGIYPEQKNAFGMFEKQGTKDWMTLGVENNIEKVVFIGEYVFVFTSDSEMAYVDVFPVSKRTIQPSSLSLSFDGAKRLSIRLNHGHFLLHSDGGRVVTIDTERLNIGVDFVLN